MTPTHPFETGAAALGSDLGLGLLLVLGLIRVPSDERRRFVLTLATTLGWVVALQLIIARPRPLGGPLEQLGLPLYAFPSGHAALAVVCAVFLAVRERDLGRGLGLFIVAASVAALRVVAHAHFVTDVVVGAGFGLGLALAGRFGGRDERPAWGWGLFPWLATILAMGVWATVPLGRVDTLFFVGADKPIHFLGYGLVGFFAVGFLHRRSALTVVAVISGAAIVEELLQTFLPGRSVDAFDAIVSVAGIAVLGALGAVLRGNLRQTWPGCASNARVHP